MVQEAEEFAEQDKAVKAKVDARNALETYCYNMKQTIEDKLGDKLEEDDKEKVRALLPLHPLSSWPSVNSRLVLGGKHSLSGRGFSCLRSASSVHLSPGGLLAIYLLAGQGVTCRTRHGSCQLAVNWTSSLSGHLSYPFRRAACRQEQARQELSLVLIFFS